MIKKVDGVFINGQMVPIIKEILKTILNMVLVKPNIKMERLWFINGKMENLTKIFQKFNGTNISTNNQIKYIRHCLNQIKK